MEAKFLNGLAWNCYHAKLCAGNFHFDGRESRLLLKPFGSEVEVEVAVQKLADAANVEKAAAGAVADALECQIHVGLSKVDNNRFGLDFNIGCGLSRIAKCNDRVR